MRALATIHTTPRAARAPARGRSSRLVELLRYLLPALALSLIALVVLWPQLIGGAGGLIAPIFANAEIAGTDVMLMHNPRYLGQTRDAEPYQLTAASAYVDPKRPDRIHLESLAAELATANQRDLNLVALRGMFNRAADKLDLDGDIALTTSDGYRFETQSARIDLQSGRVIGKQPIQGSGPTGTLSADRFEIRDSGEVLRFEGRVKVTLPPRQRRNEAS
ncbi:MAG TPA: LPS export ABC transporter periplasmic protein LptC [Geminicoccaceae bacterium]|nr:LPS export ABC transporter periplasmic protein LptC [Geminicoccaceae bacterium]